MTCVFTKRGKNKGYNILNRVMLKQIKETCIYASDLDAIEKFYVDILGLELISKKPGRHVFFKIGQDVLLFFIPEVTKEEEKLPPHYAYGNQHIAFEVDEQDYHNVKQHLIDKGVKITHEEKWAEKLYSFYFDDPEGNVLEVMYGKLWG